jgi:hypothetical protein
MEVISASRSIELDLAKFLVEAKISTYAALGDEASVPPELSGSKQLEYIKGAYYYRDVYFGMFRFMGQETVYRDEQPIWSMVYAGGAVGKVSDEESLRVFEFLRRAMRLVEVDRPFRGPSTYDNGELSYFDESQGDVRNFHGIETIQRGGIEVYRLDYAGGLIR